MQEKITKKSVEALRAEAKASQKTCLLWDSELTGFGALATKSGSCSYVVQYRLGGRGVHPKRVTLGKHGNLTPEEGRKLAKEELGKVARGADIAQEKKDARHKLTGATFRDLAEAYLGVHGKDTRYWREKRARLESDDLKPIAGKAIATITRANINTVMDSVRSRSHAAARLLFADIRPIFAWALQREAIETNPMLGMTGPKPSEARDRVLADTELKALWQAASEQSWPFENVIKVLLLTGQRREEVAGMRWRELDLDAGTWTITKERCKNGKAHSVDLCPEAVRLLDPIGEDAAPRLANSTDDLVFSTTGTTPVSGFSKVKKRVDARMKELLGDKFEPWHIHDLRRTAASGMAALKFQPAIIERVLNHVSGVQGGLVGVYQRYEYREERRKAIMEWGARVMEIVGDDKPASKENGASNVVPLRAA
jgi:integrase